MPSGFYPRTEEYRKKMSEITKAHLPRTVYKKGHQPTKYVRTEKNREDCRKRILLNPPMKKEGAVEKFKKSRSGYKTSPETKQKLREANLGEKAYNWKGNNVKYSGLHSWISSRLGKPKYCAYCQNTDFPERSYQWANISHAYKRDLSDWIRLCASCHKFYDNNKIKLDINNN